MLSGFFFLDFITLRFLAILCPASLWQVQEVVCDADCITLHYRASFTVVNFIFIHQQIMITIVYSALYNLKKVMLVYSYHTNTFSYIFVSINLLGLDIFFKAKRLVSNSFTINCIFLHAFISWIIL